MQGKEYCLNKKFMLRVKFSDEAELNYYEIWDYISKDNKESAIEVLNQIDKIIETISLYSLLWIDLKDGNRLIVDSKYKYKIVYRIKKDCIYIVSIFKYQNMWTK